MSALWRSSSLCVLVIGCLIFLAYLVAVVPSVDTNSPTQDVKQRVLLSKNKSPVEPVKLRPTFLSKSWSVQTLDDEREIHKAAQEDLAVQSFINPLMPLNEMHDDYMKFINYVDENDIQNPLLNKHNYRFLINNKYACTDEVFLLVLIHSAANKQNERNEIRKTWGAVRIHSGANIVVLFLLARPSDNTNTADILKESRTYRDIIQGDFVDHYRNLTYKNVMGLHWTMTYCNHTKFVLKTDDDTMVDTYHLISFLFQKSPDGEIEDFLYCSTFRNQGPVRSPGDKWFVTLKDYPYTKYPPYCEGFAYVMSIDVVNKLYMASKTVPFYWVDDVYVTGFLAAKAGVYHHDMESGHGYNLMQSEHLSRNVQSSIFLLAKFSHLRKNWNRAWNDILTLNAVGVDT